MTSIFETGIRLLTHVAGWMTPRRQLRHLLEARDIDAKSWESFRDGLIRRWTNLNIVCGLIMSAGSTILFSNFYLSRVAFAFGVMSLLSSLICIGFGVGLMYVLGDVHGVTLKAIGLRFPNLYLFALSIPQIWGGISFGAFFVNISLIGWDATDKGFIVKAGITAMLLLVTLHLVGFAFLFRSQDNPEYLIPEPEHLFPSPILVTSSASEPAQENSPSAKNEGANADTVAANEAVSLQPQLSHTSTLVGQGN